MARCRSRRFFNWGFNGSSHFSQAFRAQYGLSPRAFRKQAQKG
jgi:AraC-like DNA-binding protein